VRDSPEPEEAANVTAVRSSREVTYAATAVVTGDRILRPGWVTVDSTSVSAVGEGPPTNVDLDDLVDLGDVVVTPGFIELHAHGGGGMSFSDGAEAAAVVTDMHRTHGTTRMMASLVTDTLDSLEDQIRALAPLVTDGELLGIHLEGPWLSRLHCGAHDPTLLRDPRLDEIDRLLDAGGGAVRMVTLAVELEGGMEAAAYLAGRGVIVALGHSGATYAEGRAAIDAGASVATHLYNAERVPHHREPGLVLALLERDDVTVELIADGVHLHPAMLREAALRKPDRFVLVSDAMAAAGVGDGTYRLGSFLVEVRGPEARLTTNGTIAGSTLTLDRALRHAVEAAGIPLLDAVRAITMTPASVLGRSDFGRLVPGAVADLVILRPDLQLTGVMVGGRWVRGGPDRA
jgi:N-acetylglucosamine-6-phosphate deacetylase